jgi:hypothetical protein
MVMKGQWKTVEAVLGGVIILLFVAVLSTNYADVSPSVPAHGYRALSAVYEKGTLRSHAAAMDAAALNSELGATGYLMGYNHSVSICNESACVGTAPDKDYVWASSMLIAGDESYNPVEVIVYVFRN